MTQGSVSRITGLSRNYISDIENGRYMPSIDSLSRIAICLNLDLNVLKEREIQVHDFEKRGDFDANGCPNVGH
jgi:transcriptional regulator with XRE-family HTH domain